MASGGNYPLRDRIPEVGPVTLRVRVAQRPRAVTLEPGGAKLKAVWARGALTVTVPRLHIHAAVALDGAFANERA